MNGEVARPRNYWHKCLARLELISRPAISYNRMGKLIDVLHRIAIQNGIPKHSSFVVSRVWRRAEI